MGFNPLSLATDTVKETKGSWVEVQTPGGPARFLIARIGNPKYTARFTELMKPLRAANRVPGIDLSEQTNQITRQALAETVLLGWEGVTETTPGGEVEVPYSIEKAVEFLQIRDFADMVVGWASDADRFRCEARDIAAKN